MAWEVYPFPWKKPEPRILQSRRNLSADISPPPFPTGPHQIRAHRRERHRPHHGWEAGDGRLARGLAHGVSQQQAYAERGCYDPGGEDVRGGGEGRRWGGAGVSCREREVLMGKMQ